MGAWCIVFLKELKDASRDRRALLGLLILPLLGPLMVYFMLGVILDISEESRQVELPVLGRGHALDLMDFLSQQGVTLRDFELPPALREEDPLDAAVLAEVRRAIAQRQHDFVLVVPTEFQARQQASSPVNIELHYEGSRPVAQGKINRVQSLIRAWGDETAALRLMARGVSPDVINPVSVRGINHANARQRAAGILNMVPLLVIVAAFASGMGVAIDASAGERERKSLEPLLVNPVARESIVVGKWLAAAAFSALGMLLALLFNLLVLLRVPLEQAGISLDIGMLEVSGMLMTILPLALFAPAMQLLVGSFARSFKDAQSYLSVIMLLPMLPYFYNMFNTQDRQFWMNFVPMLGQNMLLADVVTGKTPQMLDFALAGATVLLLALLFISCAGLLFRREKVIFT